MEKITFVHVSKVVQGSSSILLLPMGLIALANYLKENKIDSEILHLELEKKLNPEFDLVKYFKSNRRRIICFDLHWHQQSYNVISEAQKIKKEIPDSSIVLGGFTASFFAKEILTNFLEIDYIVRGDSEKPLLQLASTLLGNKDTFSSIPNLTWRSRKTVITNNQSYVISPKIIDNLSYSNFKLIRNYKKYCSIQFDRMDSVNSNKYTKKIFYYICGRGCPVNCSYCGGSNISQGLIRNEKSPVFIKHEAVIRELRGAIKNGFETWYAAFDPCPSGDYYTKLFKKIKEAKLNIAVHFECFSIPHKKFIDEFSSTFDKTQSILIISPQCGSNSVRKKNRGHFFTNSELINILEYAFSKGVRIELSFTPGLAHEKKEDIVKTLILINFLRNKFKDALLTSDLKEFEPASPQFMDRKKYGMISERKKFKDFYEIHKNKSGIGYETEHLKMEEIESIIKLYNAEIKCIKKQSLFLEVLLENKNNYNKIDFNNIGKECSGCINYKSCF